MFRRAAASGDQTGTCLGPGNTKATRLSGTDLEISQIAFFLYSSRLGSSRLGGAVAAFFLSLSYTSATMLLIEKDRANSKMPDFLLNPFRRPSNTLALLHSGQFTRKKTTCRRVGTSFFICEDITVKTPHNFACQPKKIAQFFRNHLDVVTAVGLNCTVDYFASFQRLQI